MGKIKKRYFLGVLFLLPIIMVVGWNTYIYRTLGMQDEAWILTTDDYHTVRLTQTQILMVHDPVSALMPHTNEKTIVLRFPREMGEIDASRIQVFGKISKDKLSGKAVLSEGNLVIDASYTMGESAVPWNGSYDLNPIASKTLKAEIPPVWFVLGDRTANATYSGSVVKALDDVYYFLFSSSDNQLRELMGFLFVLTSGGFSDAELVDYWRQSGSGIDVPKEDIMDFLLLVYDRVWIKTTY